MNIKFVSKNNIGVVTLLVLVVLLTQSRFFNFMLDSHLGRTLLLAVIIFLSYLNKILGTVAVLFVAILISTSNYDYLEGFNGNNNMVNNNNMDDSKNEESQDRKKDINMGDRMTNENSEKNKDQNQLPRARIVQQIRNSNEATTPEEPVSEETNTSTNEEQVTEETATSVEGFNILSMENDIRRGKNSNSIPVNSFMRNSDAVSPYEFSNFADSFMSL